jgi:glycerol uptake facilitator-like aquaporin
MSTSRKILAEFLGTAVLLCTVVDPGIMGQRLANGNDALALLCGTWMR